MNNAKNYKNFAEYEFGIKLGQFKSLFENYNSGLTDIALKYANTYENRTFVLTVPDIIDALYYLYYENADKIDYKLVQDNFVNRYANSADMEKDELIELYYIYASNALIAILNRFIKYNDGIEYTILTHTEYVKIANELFDKVYEDAKDAIYIGKTYADVAHFVANSENEKYAFGFAECGPDMLTFIEYFPECVDYEKLGYALVNKGSGGFGIYKLNSGYYFTPDPMFINENC